MTDNKQTMISRLARLLLAASILVLAACSDSGGSGSSQGTPEVETLQTGDTAEVFEGDELEHTSDDTRVQVRHEEDTDRKFVTILSGTAELIRGDAYQSR